MRVRSLILLLILLTGCSPMYEQTTDGVTLNTTDKTLSASYIQEKLLQHINDQKTVNYDFIRIHGENVLEKQTINANPNKDTVIKTNAKNEVVDYNVATDLIKESFIGSISEDGTTYTPRGVDIAADSIEVEEKNYGLDGSYGWVITVCLKGTESRHIYDITMKY